MTASVTRADGASAYTPELATAPATCTTTNAGTESALMLEPGIAVGSGAGNVTAAVEPRAIGMLASVGGAGARNNHTAPPTTITTETADATSRAVPTHRSHSPTTVTTPRGGIGRGGNSGASDIPPPRQGAR
jgi:hypothetical protein